MKALYQILFMVVILLGIGGCSWIGGFFGEDDDPSDADQNYREAVQALENKDYKRSGDLVREIKPDSPVYSKGLQLLQQIPLQKAQDAIDSKEYAVALRELNKIAEGNSNYPKAQQLKARVVYQVALEDFHKAGSSSQKIRTLEQLAEVAIESRNMENVLQTIDMIGDQLNQATQPEEVETLILLLDFTTETQQDVDIVYAGLEQSFLAYNQFNHQPRFRDQLLRLIAKLKMNLQ